MKEWRGMICRCVYVCVCVRMCVSASVSVRVWVCEYVCAFLCACVCACVCEFARIRDITLSGKPSHPEPCGVQITTSTP